MPAKIAAGNWKMNGTADALRQIEALGAQLPDHPPMILICPPAPLLHRAAELARLLGITVGGQDCHSAASGAHTGDISAGMLADAGASHVILGHSERRTDHGEGDATVMAKCEAAWEAGLTAIICLGESLGDREAGRTLDVIGKQLEGSLPAGVTARNTVVAYEPIWAIGTGKVPSLDEIGEVHDFLRKALEKRFGTRTGGEISLLYGGSVKAGNAEEIFGVANVDGALVGGASLKAEDFAPIVDALARS
jgi:triosephosphate isomerase